jgi:hypothetical protein
LDYLKEVISMAKVIYLDGMSEEEKLAEIESQLEFAKLVGLADDDPIDEWLCEEK